jgi:hypothetical protein
LHLTVEATSRTERQLMQEADRRVAARPLEGVAPGRRRWNRLR